jgi:hypothetical protein
MLMGWALLAGWGKGSTATTTDPLSWLILFANSSSTEQQMLLHVSNLAVHECSSCSIVHLLHIPSLSTGTCAGCGQCHITADRSQLQHLWRSVSMQASAT